VISVFNVIPQTLSGEVTRDSEPSITVNPSNPLEMAISTFTFDPAGPAGTGPIFVSVDRGRNWTLNSIVPTAGVTADISIRFGSFSRILYCGSIVRATLETEILRTTDFTGAAPMALLVNRGGASGQRDQPWVSAATVASGPDFGKDRVYATYNDLTASPQTATVDLSLDAAAAPPAGFTASVVENRTTSGQDSPAVRSAVHPSGVVYLAFLRRPSGSGQTTIGDVIVRRDDTWGASATPFSAISDISDGLAGRKVATGLHFPFLNGAALANERMGGELAIAVDPSDWQRVYVAHSAGSSNTDFTVALRRSDDGGATWTGNLLTLANCKNVALAVNAVGRVGFLHQELATVGGVQRWQTRLKQSTNQFTGVASDDILATAPITAAPFTASGNNHLGDYAGLVAVGRHFYGAFSSDNTPDNANFPSLVTYRRNANFGTQQLLHTDGTTVVAPSIDPFFVDAQPLEDVDDVYVRDWTDGPGAADPGDEPSSHPVFYATSDVWNQRTSSTPNISAADQPVNENPGNGAGTAGDNFAFARVHRKAAGPATSVTAHFMYSEFGTGSNYVDAGAEMVPFAAGDAGPHFTPAHAWHLAATSSNHLCLAVEIGSAADPFIPPSLIGATPGWTTGTDLRVLADNNKAQRNMGVYDGTVDGLHEVTYYAIVHNSGTGTRDIEVRYQASPATLEAFPGARVGVAGGRRAAPVAESGSVLLEEVAPGENRWLALTLPSPTGRPRRIDPFLFWEMAGDVPASGFGIGVRASSLATSIAQNARMHASLFRRFAGSKQAAIAKREVEQAEALLGKRASGKKVETLYAGLVRDGLKALTTVTRVTRKGGDPTGAAAKLKELSAASGGRDRAHLAAAHAALLHALDALLTMRQKEEGDPADVLQNLRLQAELLARRPQLAATPGAALLLRSSRDLMRDVGRRRRTPAEFAGLLRDGLDVLAALPKADRRNAAALRGHVEAVEASLGSLAQLQRAHRELLLTLSNDRRNDG
jgi:hypothetical protein